MKNKHRQELIKSDQDLLSSLFTSVLCQGPLSSSDDCSYVRYNPWAYLAGC